MPMVNGVYQPDPIPSGLNAVDQEIENNWRGPSSNWYQNITNRNYNGNDEKQRSDLNQQRDIFFQKSYANKIRENQAKNYNDFDVDRYVKGESDVARRNMARNVMDSQKTIKGNANSSGMLFSGRRQMGEALVGQQANQDFAKYQQDLIGNALKQKQQLAADPLQGFANASAADLKRQLEIQQMQSGLQSQGAQIQGAGLGMIGQGLGEYYGIRSNNLSTPTLKQPTLQANNASTYYDNPRA